MPKVIKTGIAEAIKVQKELCEHYSVKIHPNLSDELIARIEKRIHLLKLTIEALSRLDAKEHAIDGRCPECDRRLSESEIKEYFFCPKCGQALINPEKHAEIIEEV